MSHKSEVDSREASEQHAREERLKRGDKERFEHQLAPIYVAVREGENHPQRQKSVATEAVETLNSSNAPAGKIEDPTP